MNIPEIEVVINSEYGGFSLDQYMADWLVENKGWSIVDYYNDVKQKDDKFDLYRMGGGTFYPKNEVDIDFRTNKDLIECVKFFQDKYKNLTYSERNKMYSDCRCKFFDLKIEKVKITIEIDDYHDGKEKICVSCNTE